ncbi:response regulator transcription factor [Enterococcus sp. BWM-S5]|uniref:Response regulator transcription factor n=1 Tax=Enterococcus larvae TaxID=2794352 RepID=A0ABS4CKV4_9ENTE|nr:LytTR family DNA-binding domain-containing protein [Enterococcus larvae]MBP1047234.1 response regulator transcription factor [Enterococcus larvae]
MINIFICDDSIQHLENIKEIIKAGTLFLDTPMNIKQATTSPKSLLEAMGQYKDDETNVYFLDIDLADRQYDGLQLAVAIRERDPLGFIVFVTSHVEFGFLTFEYKLGAFDYIVKTADSDILRSKIFATIKAIEKRWNTKVSSSKEWQQTSRKIRFVSDYEEKYVGLEEIIAMEVIGNHKLQVVTKHQIFECNSSLGNFEKQLPEYFFRCHRSYIINLKEVESKSRTAEEVVMTNGFVVQCAKRQQKKFLELIKMINS